MFERTHLSQLVTPCGSHHVEQAKANACSFLLLGSFGIFVLSNEMSTLTQVFILDNILLGYVYFGLLFQLPPRFTRLAVLLVATLRLLDQKTLCVSMPLYSHGRYERP